MCGIAGIASLKGHPVEPHEVRAMCGVMVHRGPDDEGLYLGTGVGLGMRRLSILDLETGNQPVRNEDGSVWVVFNGEIYNFAELRNELRRRGHSFYTSGDTEAIVHLYEEYGTRCVDHLRGMFAFALWDERRRQLMLARDRVGIKPLYWAEVDGRLLFASELKALLQLPAVRRDLNWRAVNHLFTFLSTPRSESIICGIRKLEPGHQLVVSPERGVRIERYWDVRFEPDRSRSEGYFVRRLRELLEESVRLHLVSDVALGAFLSGGIDSSTVVATMARLTQRPVKTFSIGFTDPAYSELGYARLVAERFGTEHHELVLEPDVIGVIEDLAWYLDEPLGDPSVIPTYMVSKLASEHVKVVLSGDGGDELFAGYDKYVVEARERRYSWPAPVRRLLGLVASVMPDGMRGRNLLRHQSLAGWKRYLDAGTLFTWSDKQKLFRDEIFELISNEDPFREWLACLAAADGGWLAELQYLDLVGYLPLDILTKVDRMSMAHSLEARVPLLDHKVIEFVATIPPELRLRDGKTKYILKRAVGDMLPSPLIARPKQGFAIPLGAWFRGRLHGFVRELLLSESARRRAIFDPAYIELLLRRNARGRALDFQLWTLISFELWCRSFLDSTTPWRASPAAGDRSGLAVKA
jgi:asparagine synthase (glutamine-hydrolysing)